MNHRYLVSSIVLVLSFTSANAESWLLQYRQTPGYSPKPTTVTITVTNEGRVSLQVESHRNPPTTTTEELGTISASRLEVLRTKIEDLDPKKLIDESKGQPFCTDTPTLTYSATKSDQTQVVVHKRYGCHNFLMHDSTAQSITTLLEGLVGLARL